MKGCVVVATAKVQIFKQITTVACESRSIFGCCCYRKGTNFQANHNRIGGCKRHIAVVVATAKVQIFKQITTSRTWHLLWNRLLLLPQRYKFSSKSQLVVLPLLFLLVVVATAKVQIFKQITTKVYFFKILARCCCYRKGTNFQANHNSY